MRALPSEMDKRRIVSGRGIAAFIPLAIGGKCPHEGGGLASYQSDFPALFRRGGALVARILKGARPADTPFEQATKLDLAINLKAAQALGITVPPALLIAADHVIR